MHQQRDGALPGLQGRNRQAVCTTRIGLLTRAMLLYASDYDETPPFLGLGYGSTFNKTYPGLDHDLSEPEAADLRAAVEAVLR